MSLSEFRWHLSQVVRLGSAKPPCLSSNLRGASNFFFLSSDKHAGVAESADAQDLKSCGVTTVPVQVWSPAPKRAVALFLCPDLIEQCSMVCKHTELVRRTCISRKYVIVQKISIGVYSITWLYSQNPICAKSWSPAPKRAVALFFVPRLDWATLNGVQVYQKVCVFELKHFVKMFYFAILNEK